MSTSIALTYTQINDAAFFVAFHRDLYYRALRMAVVKITTGAAVVACAVAVAYGISDRLLDVASRFPMAGFLSSK